MKNSKLQKILEAHKLWIDSNKKQGEPANFCGATIREVDFREADLRGSNFRGCDLSESNIYGANFRGAIIRGANIRGVHICEANLDLFGRSSVYGQTNCHYNDWPTVKRDRC